VNNLLDTIQVGLIQTDIFAEFAWKDAKNGDFRMEDSEADRCWLQIKSSLREMKNTHQLPDIIILPELSIPNDRVRALQRYANNMGSIIIGGLDYEVIGKIVKNNAVVIIPSSLKSGKIKGGSIKKIVGKIHAAPYESKIINHAGFQFKGDEFIWLFQSDTLGTFGVTICYDLMDLERALIYRSKIHHLFVLAYNKDIDSFYHLAEAFCRTLYCNVVICNTGFHGGSIAVKPFHESWKRVIYRHEGAELVSSQVVELPVRIIDEAQKGTPAKILKNKPPGFVLKEQEK